MNKLMCLVLIGSALTVFSQKYDGSTTAAVTIAGGIVKAQSVVVDKKYKRKDCPVCLGKGYYISGDKITKVNCGYCEPDSKETESPVLQKPKVIIHPPVNFQPNCVTGTCSQIRR
jgi:hypothetical protein